MPRALDPNQRIPLVLDSDASKPEPRPTFYCRAMSTKEWREVIGAADAHPDGGPLQQFEDVFTALRIAIVGWSNMVAATGEDIQFSQSVFENLLDPAEARELLHKVVQSPLLTEVDAKKSELPSPSNTESSAKSVAAASASTVPASKAPSSSSASSAKAAGVARAEIRAITS